MHIHLVIRTLGQSLTEKLTHLLPNAQVFSAQALVAMVKSYLLEGKS